MSFLARYLSNLRRRPTSSSSPRRLWWSCLCTLRCSVRSEIRLVSSATWTSGEPVSPSLVACPAMTSFFTAVSSGTLLPLHVDTFRFRAQARLMSPYEGSWGRYRALQQIAGPTRAVSRLRAQLTRPDTPADPPQYHATLPAR